VDLMLAEQGFVLSEVDRVQPLGDVHRRSRTRFDSHDGPRETESPGWARWPAAMGSMRPVRHAAGECLLFSAYRTAGVDVLRTSRVATAKVASERSSSRRLA